MTGLQKQITKTIVLTGLTAGTLDISAAFFNYYIATGKNPMRVLEFIASGVFGKAAFSGDPMMLFYGLVFHFCIATWWTVLFFFLYPKITINDRYWILNGTGYAVFVWAVMTKVVLPLSNIPQQPFDLAKAFVAVATLIACIGLPISYSARKYYVAQKQI